MLIVVGCCENNIKNLSGNKGMWHLILRQRGKMAYA